MSSNYEMMYILRPDLPEEQVQQEITKYQTLLSDYKAEDILVKNLGKRRLAYPIKKYIDGIYVQVNYSGDGKQVALVERTMRLGDEVIRYLTTKLKDEKIVEKAEEAPVVTEETPTVAEEAPVVTEETPTVAEETPTVAEEAPVVTEKEAPVVTEEEAPAVTEDETPAVTQEETPVVTEG